MDGFDPLTCGVPSRSRVDEDDEREAEAAALAAPLGPVLVTWTPAARASFVDGKARPALLVLAFGHVASAVMHHMPGAQVAGSLALPELSMAGHAAAPSPRDAHCCHVLSLPCGALLAAAGGGEEAVPPHRAAAWAAALFDAVAPGRVVALAPLPAGAPPLPRAGGGSAAPLAALHTAAAAAPGAPPPAAPLLPPGPLVGGAPAAVLSHCQLAGVPARLYVHDASAARAASPELLAAALAAALEAEAAAVGLPPLRAPDAARAAAQAGHLPRGGNALYT